MNSNLPDFLPPLPPNYSYMENGKTTIFLSRFLPLRISYI